MSLTEFPDVIQGKDVARFMKFVQPQPGGCWEWQSVRNNSGYGKFWLHGRTDAAHRVSYRIHNGPIPAGLAVRHTCDNPPCVNPAHLLVGTGKDNARDALERDRYRRGSDNPKAKLTEAQVIEIRQKWAAGEATQLDLSRSFGVSRSAIWFIVHGRNWAHAGGAA